jgi:chromosome partitioning protein
MAEPEAIAAVAVSIALSGGQGKTLTAYMLGMKAAHLGVQTLLIDADPQRNLTDLLRIEVPTNEPTLLEVIQGDVAADNAFYPVPERENLFLIPSDRALNKAQHYLSQVGNSAAVLRKRLKPVMSVFELIVIDTPPQKSHLCLTALGAANYAIIPAEAAAKGVNSLAETWALIEECTVLDAFGGQVIGVVPFRAKWVGNRPTIETRTNMELMEQMVGQVMLPPLLESEVYKRSINYATIPSEISVENLDLEYPFDVLLQRILPNYKKAEMALA